MLEIGGFTATELVYEGGHSAVWRARRHSDQRSVVLKVPRTTFPSANDLRSARREYEMARHAAPAVARGALVGYLGLQPFGGSLALVLEDFGAVSLDALVQDGGLPLPECLALAIALGEAVDGLHQSNVLHCDIKPSNVLWHASTQTLKLCDMGSAAVAADDSRLQDSRVFEGTLAYTSPEQTRRTKHRVDHRSDLYSLGVTLYELLTGRRPFVDDDPMVLVHCHLAVTPESPRALRGEVPEALAAIVLKLLAKDPEGRYRSAGGLVADLTRCRDEHSAGVSTGFALGRDDAPTHIELPEKIYGREAEVAALASAFHRAAAGASELLLVKGYSGVGKTSLIQHLQGEITARGARLCGGKYDQLQRNVPYLGLASALRALVRSMLSAPEEEVGRWRARIADAVGVNAGLLLDLVPELGVILGVVAEVEAVGPAQTQARFRNTVLAFVAALATAEQPLVLFLDDLQWADGATLTLLRELLTDGGIGHLLVVGAYRDNEVDASHPLTATVSAIEKARAVEHIEVLPLTEDDVGAFVADALRETPEACAPLSALVWQKTRGNPFYTGQFLKALHAEGALRFDRARGRWGWDLHRGEALGLSDNVADLMVRRIHRLDPLAVRALCFAACVGSRFDLQTLGTILELGEDALLSALSGAVREGLVLPVLDDGPTRMRFLHDRVQQAAYSLITDADRPGIHLTIGRHLLAAESERHERVFEIVHHLDAAVAEITDAGERARLAALNLVAARRAKVANAYSAAVRYARVGLDLAGAEAWSADYPLALALHQELAECHYADAEFGEMERECANVITNARSLVERVSAYELRLLVHTARYELPEGVAAGLALLSLLGVKAPAKPNKGHVVAGLAASAWRMRGKGAREVLALPAVTDPAHTAAQRILVTVLTPAYLVSPDYFPLLTFEGVRVCLLHGNSVWAGDLWMSWAVIQIAALGDIDAGYAMGKAAVELTERQPTRERFSRVYTNFNLLIRHWKEPLRDTVEPFREASRRLAEQGELTYACVSAVSGCAYMLTAGFPLDEVKAQVLAHKGAIERMRQDRFLADAHRFLKLVGRYQGEVGLDAPWVSDVPTIDRALVAVSNQEDGLARYVLGDLDGAMACVLRAESCIDSVAGTVYGPAVDFLGALVRVRLSARGSPRGHLSAARRSLKRLEKWARFAPFNQSHRCELVRAELARVEGRPFDALAGYERAIDLASRHGYLHERAMAHECAGRFHLEHQQDRLAGEQLTAARDAWRAWGAHAKVAMIEREFSLSASRRPGGPISERSGRASGDTDGDLDVGSVMKASQAIASEIVLPKLLRRLVTLCMENAGAQRAVLVLESKGRLLIEAEAHIGTDEVPVLSSVPVEGAMVPSSILQYVARTRDDVVLSNAAVEGMFTHDPYLAAQRVASVLCAPLIAQGKLSGVIYLENNSLTGAFTPARLEVLRMLSAQAAISIENARLYTDLAAGHRAQIELVKAQARFVPNEFLRSLNRTHIGDVELGENVHKEMSVLFSDIRGFTPLVEGMSPQEHIGFINGYLGHMEPAIIEHGGFVDSYIGDAIMALFDGSPDAAVHAGIAMSAGLVRFNDERAALGLAPVRMGVGVNTGSLTLGTIGGPMRIKCGVIGDSVNLAARIESLTKHYGSFFLVSDRTRDRLDDPSRFSFRLVDRVTVKGKSVPVSLFEVLDAEPDARREAKLKTASRYEEAQRSYFGKDFAAAERLFAECIAASADDTASMNFLARCRKYIDRAPPPGWDGVEHLDSK